MRDQIDVLNKAYHSVGLKFYLKDSDVTTNADWFNNLGPQTAQNAAAKKALRKGDSKVLNVYSVGFTNVPGGLLGYATFPQDYKSKVISLIINPRILSDIMCYQYSHGMMGW